jgi:hypothetical protein
MAIPLAGKKTPFFYNPPMIRGPRWDSYPTDTLADLVSQDSLYSYNTRLEAFRTRFSPTDSVIAAREWLKAKFRSFGYTDVYHDYFLASRPSFGVEEHVAHNVICIKSGSEIPDKYVLAGAHYDSYNSDSDPWIYAPGADDNGSGTASVLELARVLSTFDNKRSLIFAAFGAEELLLWGSRHLAQTLYDDSTDLELMINLDMVGYTEDADPDAEMGQYYSEAYLDVFISAMQRVSNLYYIDGSSNSDHVAFSEMGFRAIHMQEGDFNYGGWHTNLDLTSRMDFPYLEQMVRTLVASVAVVDQSMEAISFEIFDSGDGQSLRINWEGNSGNDLYRVIYGPDEDNLNDTADVPPSSDFYDLSGLAQGQTYCIGVTVIPNEGYPPIDINIEFGTPLSIPRIPSDVVAEPDSAAVILSWRANGELDMSHYIIYRKEEGQLWEVATEEYYDTVYTDTDVISQRSYQYRLCAVDLDANISDSSAIVSCTPASFDAGLLLVDETQSGGINPNEAAQFIFYSSLFGELEYSTVFIDDDQVLTRSVVGQYKPVFWIDDDDSTRLLINSIDTLNWYLEYDTDFLLAGWSTVFSMTGQTYFYPGYFFYDNFGISYIGECPLTDFIGAAGSPGWPDLEVKPETPHGTRLPDIDIFEAAPGAEVIYTFNSFTSHPYFDGKPVGIAVDTYHGKRIILGFPLYWLTVESAQALTARVLEYFAEESVCYGDANGDWSVNLLDITYLINYLYKDGPPPPDMNNGDPNGSCTVNILDVTYLISYLYKEGPGPLEGCVI